MIQAMASISEALHALPMTGRKRIARARMAVGLVIVGSGLVVIATQGSSFVFGH